MEKKEVTFNDHVRLSIESGVAPIELVYYPIIEMDGTNAIAFRSSTIVHSIMCGDLKEEDYIHVSDNRLVGIELLKHNIQHAMSSLRAFDKSHKRCDFISVRCPAQLLEKKSLYYLVKELLEANPMINPSRICIEFPENLLDIDEKLAREAVLDLKLLKVRAALQGVGKEDFKVGKLVSIPVDCAIIDKSATEWVGNRNKPQLFNSLLSYISAMGVESIATGTEEQKKEMHFSEAVGFMFEGTEPITLIEAIKMCEEADN